MAMLIGNVGEFDEHAEKIYSYLRRVTQFFLANEIPDERQAPAFLSIMGPKTFQKVTDLVHPKLPEKCKYDELVQTLKDHYKPKVIQIYERFNFYKRNQEDNESIANYVAALKSLASSCNFKNKVEEYLLDRFVVGLQDEATQRALLAVEDLDFKQAVSVAFAREAAARDVKEFASSQQTQHSSATNSVNSDTNKIATHKFGQKKGSNQGFRNNTNKGKSTGNQSSQNASGPCPGCGDTLHLRSKCPFRSATCHYCKKVGHIIKVCFKAKKNQATPTQGSPKNTYAIGTSSMSSISAEYIFYSDNVEPFNVII